MNKVRILNYLIDQGYIKENSNPLDLLCNSTERMPVELIKKLEYICTSRFSSKEWSILISQSATVAKFIQILLIKGVQVPLRSKDFPPRLAVKISHDQSLDDLDLGLIILDSKYIDWDKSIESYDLKLTSEGISYVYDTIPYTKLYDDLTFSWINNKQVPDN
jgi:hypothetical protein